MSRFRLFRHPLQTQLVPHQTPFYKGSYSAFAFDFAASSLVLGADYDAKWTVKPSTFPNAALLDWYNPAGAVPGGGVWGYHHLDLGNYDDNAQQIPTAPRQVSAINTFGTEFDWTWSGSPRFDLLHEFWLTSAPHSTGGNKAGIPGSLFEIGAILYPGVDTYFALNDGTAVGTGHVNNGINYAVRKHGTYITFAKSDGGAVLSGNFDWKAALQYLIVNGVITGSEWVNGVAFGVEPNGSPSNAGRQTGRATVNNLAVTLN